MPNKKIKHKKKSLKFSSLPNKILSLFRKNKNVPLNYKQIASKLNLKSSEEKNAVIHALRTLVKRKKLEEVDRGKFIFNASDNYVFGTIDLKSSGNAYLIQDDENEPDLFIPNKNLNKSLDKDYVKVYVYNERRNKKTEAEVVEIIERKKTQFVGLFQKHKSFGFVIPDDRSMYADIFISKKEASKYTDGYKVLAEITDWPDDSNNPFGTILSEIGLPGAHDTEIHSILHEYGLPYSFPDEVTKEADAISFDIETDEIAKRKDLRDVLTFTIDPTDAKDFDDAISYKKIDDSHFQIGVHIADVSHYVQPGSILDKEAYLRATSVYLVDRVVPMLPEKLSNGVCSLRPHEDKLTFSVLFTIDENMNVVKTWYGKTVIHSNERFSYQEAQFLIEDTKDSTVIPASETILNEDKKIDIYIYKAIKHIFSFTDLIRQQRLKNGALSFNKQEVKFHLDQSNNPTGVYVKESKEANHLIEELMLLANKHVATVIGKVKKNQIPNPFVYRIHDEPDDEKLNALQGIIKNFGYQLDLRNKKTTTQSLNKLLKDAYNKPESNMIETLAVRSMSKAIYSTDNIGHYGLSFDFYSHFTSPIRRYPDVLVHRLLMHYQESSKKIDAEALESQCSHCSDMELLATKAERDSIKYMQVKYMQQFQNHIFDGVISGVTEWGIYVEIIDNKCEGMVRTKDITDDYYIFDEKEYALVGQSSHHIYRLGDPIKVKVLKADLEKKHLDFTIVYEN